LAYKRVELYLLLPRFHSPKDEQLVNASLNQHRPSPR